MPGIPKLWGTWESPGEKWKILVTRSHPIPIKSKSQGGGSQALVFFKILGWFQNAAKFGNHWMRPGMIMTWIRVVSSGGSETRDVFWFWIRLEDFNKTSGRPDVVCGRKTGINIRGDTEAFGLRDWNRVVALSWNGEDRRWSGVWGAECGGLIWMHWVWDA